MTYNTSLKCTSRIIRIYPTSVRQGYGDDVYHDMTFDAVDGDSGHSVSLISNNYIQLGGFKHYVIFGMLSMADDVINQVIAVDSLNNTLTEDDGFFPIQRNRGTYFPACTTSAFQAMSGSSKNSGSSRNYVLKAFKTTTGSGFAFKLRGYASSAENLPLDAQLIIIEMSG
jgi:hypothetical protein